MDVANRFGKGRGIRELLSLRFEPVKCAVVCLVLLFAVVGLVVFFRPLSPRVAVMPLPKVWPKPKQSLVTRWKSAAPLWLWRLKRSLLGPAKVVLLDTTIIDFNDPSGSGLSELSLGEPEFTDTSGLRVWIIENDQLSAVHRRLQPMSGDRLLASPRAATADGVQARVFIGNTISIGGAQREVGVAADFAPRLQRDIIDLKTIIVLTEAVTNQLAAANEFQTTNGVSIRTNFAVAAKIQIPKGKAVFLLGSRNALAKGHLIGVTLSASVLPSKK